MRARDSCRRRRQARPTPTHPPTDPPTRPPTPSQPVTCLACLARASIDSSCTRSSARSAAVSSPSPSLLSPPAAATAARAASAAWRHSGTGWGVSRTVMLSPARPEIACCTYLRLVSRPVSSHTSPCRIGSLRQVGGWQRHGQGHGSRGRRASCANGGGGCGTRCIFRTRCCRLQAARRPRLPDAQQLLAWQNACALRR